MTILVVAESKINLAAWTGKEGHGAVIVFQEPTSRVVRYSLCSNTTMPSIPTGDDDENYIKPPVDHPPRQGTSISGSHWKGNETGKDGVFIFYQEDSGRLVGTKHSCHPANGLYEQTPIETLNFVVFNDLWPLHSEDTEIETLMQDYNLGDDLHIYRAFYRDTSGNIEQNRIDGQGATVRTHVSQLRPPNRALGVFVGARSEATIKGGVLSGFMVVSLVPHQLFRSTGAAMQISHFSESSLSMDIRTFPSPLPEPLASATNETAATEFMSLSGSFLNGGSKGQEDDGMLSQWGEDIEHIKISHRVGGGSRDDADEASVWYIGNDSNLYGVSLSGINQPSNRGALQWMKIPREEESKWPRAHLYHHDLSLVTTPSDDDLKIFYVSYCCNIVQLHYANGEWEDARAITTGPIKGCETKSSTEIPWLWIGIGIGAGALVLLAIVLVLWCSCRRRSRGKKETSMNQVVVSFPADPKGRK
ncbi:hypothetical protein MKZ38_009272 [Zalerion maritima]|uniref:Uncharacterized protein n=1 Tax=Zalerion maritima TaxID=339359 RepID=A0AAD5WN74_9PEZI|nr:hypothetical protein MKZ38_009272 [Zalerion maritima]